VSSGTQWTPREALEAMLSEIDSGKIAPDSLVICFRQDGNPGFISSAPDVVTMLGLCEGAKLAIHETAK
jgi:hypothetical protein